MTTSVIPILSSNHHRLTKPVDIIKYVLRHYCYVPKNINDTFADQEISFRYDDAQSGGDKDILRNLVNKSLSSVLTRYFPGAASIDIDVSIIDIDEVRYNLSVDITVFVDGMPHTISSNYALDQNGQLLYEFEGDDNAKTTG